MIIAAMHRFNISGEEKYKRAALHFYNYLLGRTFANGNNSSRATTFIKEEFLENRSIGEAMAN